MESIPEPSTRIKTIALERSQMRWEAFDLESLIGADHPARTIWELAGRFDLQRFEQDQKSKEGEAGRPCWPARLLISVWVYGYTLGVASARALERMMSHEPGLRWLVADQTVNYHTLADFRVRRKEALEDLFAQFLALLEAAGLVDLETLLHDGTKVRTVAGRGSFHGRKTLEKRVRQARKVVRKLETAAESEGVDQRRRAAQQRAAREALERATAALKKLQGLEAEGVRREGGEIRVSESEAEARKMKQPDGGWAPSYNVQVSTEAKSRMIVGIGVTTAVNDTKELMPALEKVKENCGELPDRIIADGGYATRSNVEATSERNIEWIAPWKDDGARQAGACRRNGIAAEFTPAAFREERGGQGLRCPAGKSLVMIQQRTHHGVRRNVFEARQSECGRCRWKEACCGAGGGPRRVERVMESPAMQQYLARRKRREVRTLYGRRSEIAEFPHLWAKAVKKWRRFSVRGVMKAGLEALWVALAYNVSQWMRLRGRPVAEAVTV